MSQTGTIHFGDQLPQTELNRDDPANLKPKKYGINIECFCECVKMIVEKIVEFFKWIWSKIIDALGLNKAKENTKGYTWEKIVNKGVVPKAVIQKARGTYQTSPKFENLNNFQKILGLDFISIVGEDQLTNMFNPRPNSPQIRKLQLTEEAKNRLEIAPTTTFRLLDLLSKGMNEHICYEEDSMTVSLTNDQNYANANNLPTLYGAIFSTEQELDAHGYMNYFSQLRHELKSQYPKILTPGVTSAIANEHLQKIQEIGII